MPPKGEAAVAARRLRLKPQRRGRAETAHRPCRWRRPVGQAPPHAAERPQHRPLKGARPRALAAKVRVALLIHGPTATAAAAATAIADTTASGTAAAAQPGQGGAAAAKARVRGERALVVSGEHAAWEQEKVHGHNEQERAYERENGQTHLRGNAKGEAAAAVRLELIMPGRHPSKCRSFHCLFHFFFHYLEDFFHYFLSIIWKVFWEEMTLFSLFFPKRCRIFHWHFRRRRRTTSEIY